MIYDLWYYDQSPPQRFSSEEAWLLIKNNHEGEEAQAQLWADLQAGKKVYIRSGYLRRGDLN